ncbi:hypothetical protein Bca4012_067982 [Brassica carinata]
MLKKLCLRGVPYLCFGATVRVMVLIIVNLKLLAEFFRLHKSFFSSYSSVDFQAFDLGFLNLSLCFDLSLVKAKASSFLHFIYGFKILICHLPVSIDLIRL